MADSISSDTKSAGEDPPKAAPSRRNKKRAIKKEAKPTKEEIKKERVSKRLDAIKEQITRQREEEERLRREAEEEERRFREEKLKLEEQRRLEAERRERRKQKEKERKQRLKDEGKLLTDKEKENRRKVMELAQARGLDLAATKNDLKNRTYSRKKKRPLVQMEKSALHRPDVEEEVKVEPFEEPSDGVLDWEDLAADLVASENGACEKASVLSEDGLHDVVGEVGNSPSPPVLELNQVTDQSEAFQISESQLTEEEKRSLIEQVKIRLQQQYAQDDEPGSEKTLRSGVICVLGHVDTGKTKILDKLRNTNVQDREAGGITQQIGATNVPRENIIRSTQMCKYFTGDDLKMPGLLIIDTPGHESFTNLRVRGSSLCDFAILVVDIMHGIEEQTKESIRILLSRKTPFVVALNKIDRLYQWRSYPNLPVKEVLAKQDDVTINDFNLRFKEVVQHFALMELNVKLFYENTNPSEFISMVPTSAHSGDGMGDLLAFMCKEMQRRLYKRLTFSEELKASVMEVKETVGLGTSLDVIVVNGRIREGDTIVLAGQEGAIVTTVRSILMPAPMSELRVKGTYEHLKEVVGAQGVKLIARDLEKALAGLPLYVARDLAEELYFKDEVSRGLKAALKGIAVSPVGVYVVASTLGSLESLLTYLKSVNIPYSGISIGTVHKKDVMKASIMVERDRKWAVILAFDVKVDRDAQKMANEVGVQIFTANIIYHLQTRMEEYVEALMRENRKKHANQAVFPVKLRILPDMVFNKRAPIVVGVHVEAGLLREGTPICVPSRDNVLLGKVFSIEFNHKAIQEARTGQEVCVRIDPIEGETPKLYGRHFDHTDLLISKISRDSIDIVKEFYRNDLNKEDWKLIIELKKMLSII
ncbi:eukaryotic translation initiation factor [Echinococcus multilocularis]|uniref:Eukaryotic translation initiation factor 5B n=1 Tax=Echinococcus multilocularis TaxID=6211 RepID=A0A068YC15_ECHMU|nr:eukaryotic translation initiation factor [Echinococcus multilocularis]